MYQNSFLRHLGLIFKVALFISVFSAIGGIAVAQTLQLDKTTYTTIDPIYATYAGGPGNATDWIGIYKANDTPGINYSVTWQYVTETDGTLTISNGLAEDQYKAYFFCCDGYTVLAGPVFFSVSSSGYVIQVVFDGFRPAAITTLGPTQLPNVYRMINEGAWTANARTDYSYTETLPNHTDILTSRPVTGTYGHNVSFNSDNGLTIHDAAGSYVASVFDMVHDNGLRTGLYASKSKFAFFDRSWDATHGRADTINDDNGRDKIDLYYYADSTATLTAQFISDMRTAPFNYAMLSLRDPDSAGHASGWMSTAYLDAVKTVDGYLGQLFALIDTDPTLHGRTTVILCADHGGTGTGHGTATDSLNYTIPVFAWGPTVQAGSDLYALNPQTRMNPGTGRPDNTAVPQPIRNGDAANLATSQLGVGPIDNSLFNNAQDLTLAATGTPPTAAFSYSDRYLTVSFIDHSADSDGTIVSWSWSFGDGGRSTAQNPSHTYASAGTYTVSLTVFDNTGLNSSTSQSVTEQDASPTTPSGLGASAASSMRVNLTWTDNSSNETGFKIERATGGGSFNQIATVGANVTSYADTTVSGGTTYSYQVRATNASGDSAYSNTATATTPVSSLTAPSNLRAKVVSRTQINLSWSDRSNNEQGFYVERSPDGKTWTRIATPSANVTNYSNTGLTANNTYYYRVQAYNSAAISAYSNTVTAKTKR